MIKLYDRIKEKVYTVGTGNFVLSGPFQSFNSFSSVYSNGNTLFYVATDGARYEIGSGLYIAPSNEIQRFPIKSTNNNQKVNFPEGLKEVYVNYPATNSVFNGSGIDVLPVNSGLAFWTSSNSLSSENSFYIDSGNHRLGINKSNPLSSIDVGGPVHSSNIRASGFIVGLSGIYFPSGNNNNSSYLGGQQLTHYEMNQVDSNTGSNAVIELSGAVNQNILFKKQNAGTFLAGPVSGCSPACEPNYPVFRQISVEDLPALSNIYDIISNVPQNIRNDGRLVVGDDINSSGTIIKYNRFSHETQADYKLSLFNVNNQTWNDYSIPSNGIEFDTTVSIDRFKNSYQLFDIFGYYDTLDNEVKLSGIPWDNETYIFSSGLAYHFKNILNGYVVDYVATEYVDSNILNNEIPFSYSSFQINNNTISNGDLILIAGQTNKVENGVYATVDYQTATSGKLIRSQPNFFPGNGDVLQTGFKFYVQNDNSLWYLSSPDDIIVVGEDQFFLSSFGDLVSNLGGRSTSLHKINSQAMVLSTDYSKRYLGTIFTVNNGIILDNYFRRHVFNAHNKIMKPINITRNNLAWTYNSASWRVVPFDYISDGSVVHGLQIDNNNLLSLQGVITLSPSNLQSNAYTIGISINDRPFPISTNNIISTIDRISIDYNDNISKTLKATCSCSVDLGFTSFALSEKGKASNSIFISFDDTADSENHGGLFGVWYC